MRKYGKRFAAAGFAAAMTAAMISGCGGGTKATPENLFKDMNENAKDVESMLCNLAVELGMSYESESVGIGIDMDLEATNDPAAAHADGSLDLESPDGSIGVNFEAYSVEEDGTYVVYAGSQGEWIKMEMDEGDISTFGGDLYSQLEDMHEDFELDEDLSEVEEKDCFKLTGDISGEYLADVMSENEEVMDEMGASDMLDMDALAEAKIPCTVEIYKDDILPARINMDLQDILVTVMGEEGEDIEVSDFYIEITYVEYDKVKEIEVPDEAKDAEDLMGGSSSISDIDLDDEDEDDTDKPSKKAQVAESSGELGASWDSYTVQINDTVLTLPCEIADLEALGFTLNTSYTPANYMINVDEYELAYFMDASGNEIMVDVLNNTGEAQELQDCIIAGISVDEYDIEDGLTVIFPGGIQIGSTKDEVLAAYGEAEDPYEGDYLHMYTWYDPNSYYNGCEIDFDAETGLVNSMYMDKHE